MNKLQNLKYNQAGMHRLFRNGALAAKMYRNNPRCYKDAVSGKWYVMNDGGTYEEWGLMPTVQSLEGVSTYKGKLVLMGGHEYKWNGTQWVDLGEGTGIPIGWINVDENCYFDT